VLAERAASEGPRSTRAVKGIPGHSRWDGRRASSGGPSYFARRPQSDRQGVPFL